MKETYWIKFPLDTQHTEYPIFSGLDITKELDTLIDLSKFSKIFLVIDKNLEQLNKLKKFNLSTYKIEGTESSKNLESLTKILEFLQEEKADRRSLVIAYGGGALLDLVAFASSIYMRGTSFVLVPTTLLSQVDASIGGKNGINLKNKKNVVGTITQPFAVIIDPLILSSLSEREFNSGISEMIKHGLIYEKKHYYQLKESRINKDTEKLLTLIRESISIKSRIVTSDEKEEGLRKLLNFGHTAGHALETLSHLKGTPLLHGEAISLGLIVESKLSNLLGFITEPEFSDIVNTLKSYSLPTKVPFHFTEEEYFNLVRSDKKNDGNRILWSLIRTIGSGVYNIEASKDQILESLKVVL